MEKWILIEDEPDLYAILVGLYQMFNVKALGFGDGESALTWINQIQQQILYSETYEDELPELALIDIYLKGEITGIEVASSLRQIPALSNMVIILMTGKHLTTEQEKLFIQQSGANLLVSKPLPESQELRKLFFDLLGRTE